MATRSRTGATMPSRLLSVSQAAELLGRDPSTIRRLINAGTIPAERIGARSFYIRESDLKKIILPPMGRRPTTGRCAKAPKATWRTR